MWTNKWSEKEELEWKWDKMLALEPEFYLKILQKVGTESDKKLITFKEWFIKKLW